MEKMNERPPQRLQLDNQSTEMTNIVFDYIIPINKKARSRKRDPQVSHDIKKSLTVPIVRDDKTKDLFETFIAQLE
jgi:hypothetical protein